MAITKLAPPKKAPAQAKAKPRNDAVKRINEAARRTNSSTYAIESIKWGKDDVVKMISHRNVDYFFFLSPEFHEDDDRYLLHWDAEAPVSCAKGATFNNQLLVYVVTHSADLRLDTLRPMAAISDTEVSEVQTFMHYGLFLGPYSPGMQEDQLTVAFRQYYPEMRGSPILRAIPSSKLFINMEDDSARIQS